MDPRECESCGYVTELKIYNGGVPHSQDYALCRVCAITYAATAHMYPGNYDTGHIQILKSIAVLGNHIIDAAGIREDFQRGKDESD